jgi:hypothetical protein
MASASRGSGDAFFLRPSASNRDLSSEPWVVVCRENSVLSGHNCSDCKTPECVQLHVCVL